MSKKKQKKQAKDLLEVFHNTKILDKKKNKIWEIFLHVQKTVDVAGFFRLISSFLEFLKMSKTEGEKKTQTLQKLIQ